VTEVVIFFFFNTIEPHKKEKKGVQKVLHSALKKIRKRCHLLRYLATKEKKEGNGSNAAVAFFVVF